MMRRMEAVKALQKLPPDVQKPIIKKTYVDRLSDRFWDHGEDKHLSDFDDYHQVQWEHAHWTDRSFGALHHNDNHNQAAMDQSAQHVTNALHEAMHNTVRNNPHLTPDERAYAHDGVNERRDALHDEIQRHFERHGAGLVGGADGYLETAMRRGAFEAHLAKTYPPNVKTWVRRDFNRKRLTITHGASWTLLRRLLSAPECAKHD